MTGKRNSAEQIANKQSKTPLKWTEAMNTKLLECKRDSCYYRVMREIPNEFHQGTLTLVFAGISLRVEKADPTFSSFNPRPSLPSFATDDRKQFQCLNIRGLE